ncbi:MAG: class I adenylate-forming enzyme family protein [Alphaproteobacteria bacterium]
MAVAQQYNLAYRVLAICAKMPAATAIVTPARRIDYAEVEHNILDCAEALHRRGVNRSACVAIDTTDGGVARYLALAVGLIGCKWVDATSAALGRADLEITHLVQFKGVRQFPPASNVIPVRPEWFAPKDRIAQRRMIAALGGYQSPDDTWMIAQSSGTTGTPKFLARSYRIASLESVQQIKHYQAATRTMLSLFPPLSPASINGTFGPWLTGGALISNENPKFLFDAMPAIVYGSPIHVNRLIEGFAQPKRMHGSRVVIAGGPMSSTLVEKILSVFDSILLTYGSSEAGLSCIHLVTEPGRQLGMVGAALDDTAVEIVDHDDKALPRGSIGVIRVRCIRQVTRYIGDDVLSAQIFRNGWFYPGDSGYLDADKNLHVTGRVSDDFNVGGTKINAVEIDIAIAKTAGVQDCVAFVRDDASGLPEVAALVCVSPDADHRAVAQAIRENCARLIPTPFVPQAIYIVGGIPRNANGKVVRGEAANLANNLQPI